MAYLDVQAKIDFLQRRVARFSKTLFCTKIIEIIFTDVNVQRSSFTSVYACVCSYF